MFGIFKKKSKIEKLNTQYKKLLKEAYVLSTTNRKQSDLKYAEADAIQQEMERLQNPKTN